MALDTAHKRRIALARDRRGRSTLDGAISTPTERANVLGFYFAATLPTVVTTAVWRARNTGTWRG